MFDTVRQPINENELRQQIVLSCKWLSSQKLNQVTTGNVSARISAWSQSKSKNSAENMSQDAPADLIGRASQTGGQQSAHGPFVIPPSNVDAPEILIPPLSGSTNESRIESDFSPNLNSDPCRLEHLLITPSGQSYDSLTSEMVVKMNFRGEWDGKFIPSSEWRFHVDILKARPEINAVVHTHSMFATIQSITRRDIPACHYLIAMLGGHDIRCAPYARFGSQQLSDNAVAALEGRMACLLSNHGAIAVGKNLKQAVENAVLLETLAQQYYYANLAGVCLLTEAEIIETRLALDKLPTYRS